MWCEDFSRSFELICAIYESLLQEYRQEEKLQYLLEPSVNTRDFTLELECKLDTKYNADAWKNHPDLVPMLDLQSFLCLSLIGHLLFSLTHTLAITRTCCYDGINGIQDLKIYSHADSLILSLMSDVDVFAEFLYALLSHQAVHLTALFHGIVALLFLPFYSYHHQSPSPTSSIHSIKDQTCKSFSLHLLLLCCLRYVCRT